MNREKKNEKMFNTWRKSKQIQTDKEKIVFKPHVIHQAKKMLNRNSKYQKSYSFSFSKYSHKVNEYE